MPDNDTMAWAGLWVGKEIADLEISNLRITGANNRIVREWWYSVASLDYYNGQTVTGIEMYGEEDFEWAIRLSGGALVKNWDRRRTAIPEGLEGIGVLATTYEVDATTMKFGVVDPATFQITKAVDVVLTPTQYSITDPVYAVQEEFPQRQLDTVAEDVNTVYPAELLDREAQGPENQEDEIGEASEAEAVEGAGTEDEDDVSGS